MRNPLTSEIISFATCWYWVAKLWLLRVVCFASRVLFFPSTLPLLPWVLHSPTFRDRSKRHEKAIARNRCDLFAPWTRYFFAGYTSVRFRRNRGEDLSSTTASLQLYREIYERTVSVMTFLPPLPCTERGRNEKRGTHTFFRSVPDIARFFYPLPGHFFRSRLRSKKLSQFFKPCVSFGKIKTWDVINFMYVKY